jgi:hypothetical protein
MPWIAANALRTRAKKHCRAVIVIKGGVAHQLVAFWGRLNFQCFVRKFVTEYFEFDLAECAIFPHSSHLSRFTDGP